MIGLEEAGVGVQLHVKKSTMVQLAAAELAGAEQLCMSVREGRYCHGHGCAAQHQAKVLLRSSA